MAGKTREIKARMKAVSNIQRITKTMQMIATARYQALQRRATQAQAYTQKIAEVLGELAASIGTTEKGHRLLAPPERPVGRELMLVITSNRGLAGAYNANVLREASRFMRASDAEFDTEVVGKKGIAFFKFAGRAVARTHTDFGDNPAYADVERLAERFMIDYADGKYDAVRVAYMHFQSASRQTPEVIRLLPMEKPASDTPTATAGAATEYEFTPSAVELLDELVPMAVKTRLFQCFNEAVVSEQVSRMVAMKAATDAAGKMRKDLGRRYNRARQAAITTELSEIIAGAAALG